ncbi:DUF5134 domain-containing protein [Streptomyces sp. NPDC094458]|uniref:DUF5134 domain-containing protein n=1 Tax=unclassified Streptomyces TaxID=2593676 RepID=UPI003321D775
MLTALFGAAAGYALRQCVSPRSAGWRSSGDHLLHTVMAAAMAVMPWHLHVPSPAVLTVFFAGATLWFPVTAVMGGQAGRWMDAVRRFPDTVGMVAMAWMTHRETTPPRLVPIGQETGLDAGNMVTAVLALYLLVCALRSLTQDMSVLRASRGPVISASISGPCTRFWQGSTAMGTAIMLFMHH